MFNPKKNIKYTTSYGANSETEGYALTQSELRNLLMKEGLIER